MKIVSCQYCSYGNQADEHRGRAEGAPMNHGERNLNWPNGGAIFPDHATAQGGKIAHTCTYAGACRHAHLRNVSSYVLLWLAVANSIASAVVLAINISTIHFLLSLLALSQCTEIHGDYDCNRTHCHSHKDSCSYIQH